MIVSKTPLRLSFVGGGTDLPAYYNHEEGAVVSTTIDKYIYILINPKFDGRVRASYSIAENVDHPCELQHELIRASLELLGIDGGIEIVSVADLPGGTGLGSSSAYTVGMLHALHAFKGEKVSRYQLAEEACHVEIEMCGKPIGKQDQYAAAFGGLNYFGFHPNRTSVTVYPLRVWQPVYEQMYRYLLLLHTGIIRPAADILHEQQQNTPNKVEELRKMAALAGILRDELEAGISRTLGALMHQNWCVKRLLASGVTTPVIDRWYAIARLHGAEGGKITGAGGGGFLLLYALPGRHERILSALPELRMVPFNCCRTGSTIVYNDGGNQ
jgi:D-glycero-alpha-D-manno-heptose-7-phosphate kinase